MKKIFYLLTVTSLILFGCNKSDTDVVKCSLETEFLNATYEYEAEGDNLIKLRTSQKSDIKELGYTEEEALELLESYSKSVDGEGVTYSYEIEGDNMVENFEVDLNTADLTYLSSLGYVALADESGAVSLEDSITNLKSLGGSCDE